MFSRLKDVYFIAVLSGFGLLIWLKWDEIKTIFILFGSKDSFFLLASLFMQFLTYIVTALTYNSTLAAISARAPFWFLFKSSFSMLSLNQIIPSLGFSGSAFFVSRVKRFGVSLGKATLCMVLEPVVFYSSFIILLFLGVLYLFLEHKVAYLQIILSFVFLVLMFLGLFYLFYILRNKQRFSSFIYRIYHFVFRLLKKKENKKEFDFLILEFFLAKEMMLKQKRKFIAPFVYSILKTVFDMLTIYFIFLAFGYNPNIGVLTVGFCLATLLSYISFIPGGLGVFELSMAGIFAGFGIPFSFGFISTLIFRGMAFWLPIPIGLWFYRELK